MVSWIESVVLRRVYFFFNDTATTEIYTLSLHDASSDLGYVQKEEKSKHTAIMMSGMKAEQEKVMRNLKMSGKSIILSKQNGTT